jgi:hypothetical protein
MFTLLIFLLRLLVLPSRPKHEFEAENAALRRQLAILQHKLRVVSNSRTMIGSSSFCSAGDAAALARESFRSSLLALEIQETAEAGAPSSGPYRVRPLL